MSTVTRTVNSWSHGRSDSSKYRRHRETFLLLCFAVRESAVANTLILGVDDVASSEEAAPADDDDDAVVVEEEEDSDDSVAFADKSNRFSFSRSSLL
jgi:hypothetical protein